jgi:PKD repeat protein
MVPMAVTELRPLLLATIGLPVMLACGDRSSPTGPAWRVSVVVGDDVAMVVGRRHTQSTVFEDPGAHEPPWNYAIDWGDASKLATGLITEEGALPPIRHTYELEGVFTLIVSVTDKYGAIGIGQRKVTVVPNQPPVANANGPYASAEGEAIAFSSAGSTDPNSDTLSYQWDFGDGTTSSSAAPTKKYADNGAYPVTLWVTDPSDATSRATTTVTVANVPPELRLSAPTSIAEGSDYTITVSGSDAGAIDRASLVYALDCGVGGGYGAWSDAVKSVTCPVQPDQRATPITVRGKVRDKDAAEQEYTLEVGVTNAAPVVTFAATTPTTVRAGQSVSFQGAFTDAGVNDQPWTWSITWADGSPATTGVVTAQGNLGLVVHTYATAGSYDTVLKVTDKDGKKSSTNIAITVNP